ncbi:MAG TPA: type II toxin-antitoxin system RelE/ParE family toxin [Thermoanaerobaculia bacterium]|nr:type II toxin-antitoxin system RelE/ParE family toxin [Thermoanaerobaculia bacterium]
MKLLWSPLAIERAYEEARFIAADKPDAALRWLDGLFDATDRLEHFPDSGRVVPEIGLPEYREIVYGKSHRVVYRRDRRGVSILTVRRYRQPIDASELVEE